MQGALQGAPASSLGHYGQTVGDMNKSHYTDPPQVGVGLSDGDRVATILA